MTALSANRERRTRNNDQKRVNSITPATSITFYEGGIICVNSSGAGVKGADTSGFRTLGVKKTAEVSAASGPSKIEFEYGHQEWFPIDSALNAAIAASIGKNATILDDQTLSNAATTTNDIPFGEIVEYEVYKGVAGAWVIVGVPALSGTA